jgi:hypothetical protein
LERRNVETCGTPDAGKNHTFKNLDLQMPLPCGWTTLEKKAHIKAGTKTGTQTTFYLFFCGKK